MKHVGIIVGSFFLTFILSLILGSFYNAGADVAYWGEGSKFFVVSVTFINSLAAGMYSILRGK